MLIDTEHTRGYVIRALLGVCQECDIWQRCFHGEVGRSLVVSEG